MGKWNVPNRPSRTWFTYNSYPVSTLVTSDFSVTITPSVLLSALSTGTYSYPTFLLGTSTKTYLTSPHFPNASPGDTKSTSSNPIKSKRNCIHAPTHIFAPILPTSTLTFYLQVKMHSLWKSDISYVPIGLGTYYIQSRLNTRTLCLMKTIHKVNLNASAFNTSKYRIMGSGIQV